jgi:cell surface protein SprA
VQLYNKIPYFKRINNPQGKGQATELRGGGGKLTDKKTEVSKVDTAKKKGNENFKNLFEFLARGIMMVKNVAVTFQEQGGQALSNFNPSSQYAGMDFNAHQAPGFLFTTGWYDPNIRQNSVKNGWLAQNRNVTTPYIETKNTTYSYKSSIEPHGSLKIELNGNYSLKKSTSEYLLYDPTKYSDNQGYFFHGSPSVSGDFNISTFTFFKSFKDGNDPVKSKLFDEFLSERYNVAEELAITNSVSAGPRTASVATPYVDGYSNNQQDVMMEAFYRTYTGRNIKDYSTKNVFPKVPLPNWTVSWDGLGKIKEFKKLFNKITVRHGYSSVYSISGFNNNLLFNEDGKTQDARKPVATNIGAANFESYYNINSVTIREGFAPLLKFDFQFTKPGWSANIENKRDKTTTLNITGFQIIETKGQEYIVGLGYRVAKLKIKKLTIQGKPLESPLNIKMDVSFRKNVSVIRQIAEDSRFSTSTPTGGTNIINLSSTADYQLTPNINFRLFYTWIRTKPQTSASFPTANTTGGFSIRINFQ